MFEQETTGAREILYFGPSIFVIGKFFDFRADAKGISLRPSFSSTLSKQEEIYGGSNQNAWRLY
jgi:hypothetical protein